MARAGWERGARAAFESLPHLSCLEEFSLLRRIIPHDLPNRTVAQAVVAFRQLLAGLLQTLLGSRLLARRPSEHGRAFELRCRMRPLRKARLQGHYLLAPAHPHTSIQALFDRRRCTPHTRPDVWAADLIRCRLPSHGVVLGYCASFHST